MYNKSICLFIWWLVVKYQSHGKGYKSAGLSEPIIRIGGRLCNITLRYITPCILLYYNYKVITLSMQLAILCINIPIKSCIISLFCFSLQCNDRE